MRAPAPVVSNVVSRRAARSATSTVKHAPLRLRPGHERREGDQSCEQLGRREGRKAHHTGNQLLLLDGDIRASQVDANLGALNGFAMGTGEQLRLDGRAEERSEGIVERNAALGVDRNEPPRDQRTTGGADDRVSIR